MIGSTLKLYGNFMEKIWKGCGKDVEKMWKGCGNEMNIEFSFYYHVAQQLCCFGINRFST